MSMDARWRVYIQDRRFEDNQISNLFIKLKAGTVGRFTFDFRPIDGDESYMVANNTLRIFWGDIHKLDGVIQRVEWDQSKFCYHVYGADLRGLLTDRVNTEKTVVHSYPSDVQTSILFEGCDFPTNIWTGPGETIGKYTFNYKIGIQNTVRVGSQTPGYQWVVDTVVERGTVYGFVNECIYDATKSWTVNEYQNCALRFVDGACKNNIYKVNSNATSTVCINGMNPLQYGCTKMLNGNLVRQIYPDGGFENGGGEISHLIFTGGTTVDIDLTTSTTHRGTYALNCVFHPNVDYTYYLSLNTAYSTTMYISGTAEYSFWAKSTDGAPIDATVVNRKHYGASWIPLAQWEIEIGTDWTQFSTTFACDMAYDWIYDPHVEIFVSGGNTRHVVFDDFRFWRPYSGSEVECNSIPDCAHIGDHYEIVTLKKIFTNVPPQTEPKVRLTKDTHIIKYNKTDDLSEHKTSVTVRGVI